MSDDEDEIDEQEDAEQPAERFTYRPLATLEEAKTWLGDRVGRGARCPCCDRFTKEYRRKFNKSVAYVLLLIDRYYRRPDVKPDAWLHVPSYLAEMTADTPRRAAAVRGDWAKLKLWNLIEEKTGERDDGSKRAGLYRITKLGRQFVNREVMIPAYVHIYNGKLVPRQVKTMISFDDALGDGFNYDEIMAEVRSTVREKSEPGTP